MPLAFLLVRFPGRSATIFERIVFLAQGLPSLVVALAIVSLAVHALRPLYQSATLLVVAYAILFMPLALVSVRAAFTQAQPRLEETARSLGLGWRETARRIVLPLAGPRLRRRCDDGLYLGRHRTQFDPAALADRHAHARNASLDRYVHAGLRRRRAICGVARRHFARWHRGCCSRCSANRRVLGERADAPRSSIVSELRISGLTKSFDGQRCCTASICPVRRGTLLALLGPSGSGKTTLLRVLCGFERADGGTVEIDGRRVAGDGVHVPSEARRIGYVPQEGALFPHLSVAENIVFGLPRASVARGIVWMNCWNSSACLPPTVTARRRRSPAASSNAWRSPGRLRLRLRS